MHNKLREQQAHDLDRDLADSIDRMVTGQRRSNKVKQAIINLRRSRQQAIPLPAQTGGEEEENEEEE